MKKLKHIVSFVMVFALIFTSIPLTTFKAEAVDSAPSTDIVYGSNGNITRAEWLHDLAVVFDMSVESDAVPDNYFSDLESSHPYYNDIMLTVEFGVVDVEAGGNIFVDDLVSRDFAVTTLNFCLGYQASDEDTYTFSDSSECSSPTDALIAVEHGWVELIDNKFMPELPITSDEAKKMLDNAASVLDVSDIDANYDSKYVFQDDVIVVPEWVNTVEENMTFTIENSPVTISQGNLFAIYENGIPAVYVAENVTNDGNLTIITAKKNEGNDAFKEIDAQGQISSNDMEFYACEDVELTLSESESAPAMRKAPGLKAVKSQVKLKKDINLKTKVPLGKGLEANLTVNIYNPVVNYQLSRSYSYATLEGDTEISYSIKGDLTDALGTKSKKLFTCSVAGIGSFDVTVEMRFSGEIKGKVRGNLTAGLECVRGDRIRAIHVFQQKTCYFAAGAEASIGLKASLGITKLPGLQAYVFAEVGAKASLWSTSYDTAPYRCTHFSAYMYMRFSAYASVNLFGWKKSADYTINVFDEKNSPIKVVHHYEDGVEVPACTRGTSHTRYFTKYDSHYGGSGWTGANGSYGLDGGGNSISLYQYSVNDDNEATITKYNGNSYSVYIPETIDGYTVVKIGNSAFANKSIHDVSIPDSVTEIDSYAFNNCKYLKEVKLSKSLTYLGEGAFGLTAIAEIEIPKSLDNCGSNSGFYYDFNGTRTYMYGGPFTCCENLKTITFEKGTTQIAENLFKGCTGLESITIPDTVTEIERYAFEYCLRLTDVVIADSVTEIGNYAFNKCISLKKANLPKSLTYLGERAFCSTVIEEIEIPKSLDSCGSDSGFYYDFNGTRTYMYGGPFTCCENLKTVTFEKGTTQIAENLFKGCTGLESITIPDTVTEIERYAFEYCLRLTDAVIADSVTEIGNYAFNKCISLKKANLPKSLTYLGERAFCSTIIEEIEIPKSLDSCGSDSGFYYDFDGTTVRIYGGPFTCCENLKTVTFEKGTTQIAENLFNGCTGLEKITIPDTVTEIEKYAFEGCLRLTEAVIADSITSIERYTFNNCISLKKANLPKSLTYLGERAFCSTIIEEIEIPKSLDSCGSDSGFYYDFDGTTVRIYGGPFTCCENLKTVTFEKGTTQITNNLFSGCTGLETITVPDTIAEIEKYAFEGCVRLTEVSIPDSVTEIGEYSFKSCVSLPKIIIPNTITKINAGTFENCSSLASVTIPDSVTTIDRYAFSQCVSLPNISIPDSVTNIYECAFNECSSLESVKLPGYIQNIAYNMFQNCTSLKTVEFPSTVTTIQNAAFAGCTSLESFSFQNGKSNLQTIKYNAFQDCASLKEAVLPETINTVENNAFRNCVSLEKVYIPESTRTLGGYVFQGDELLKDVTISDYSITKINECTFKDCPALASIVLPKGLTEIGNQAFMNDTALFDVTIPESVTSITNSAFSYPAKTIIHGKAGSYAETFANDGGFKFNDIGIAAEGISLIDGIENITLDVGETYRAKFEFYPEDANDVVTMTSDNRNVSINGHDIKASYSGNSVITATSSSGIPYEFNIHTRSPRKITIKTPANKLSYLIGEEFERTGLVAEVTYDDNSTKDVTDFTISGFDSYAEGSCTVTLSWLSANGYTYKTTFSVEIVDPTPKLTGITIKSVPNKLMYERKESLNLTGLSVIGTYSDDSNREITDYTISGYNALKYGKQTITVSYNEKTATFTVAVKCATHTFNEWTTEKEPICTESGKKVHICSVCGLVEEEVIPATGHDYKTVVIEPTYTEQGYTLHTCSHCGDSYKDNYTEKLIEQLANDSVLSAETIKLGETITATGKATGGTAPYQYQVVYKKSADSKWTTAQSYKANTTVTFKPASATTYDVCIKVKDSTGTEVKKFFNINVSSILTNNSTISATSIGLGSTLTATGKANGGTAPYQYQVVYKKSTDSKWTTAQSYKANTTVTFKPASATTYDVCIKVKDSTGTEVKKFFTVKVTDALKNNSVISKTEISLGDTITVSGKATGGTSPYQYNILYKQTAQSKWTTVQSYKTNSTVTIKPAKATTYDVCVKIKDSNGTIVKKFFTVQVNAKLANTSTISATEIKKGNTVTVNGSATGGAGNYTYAVFYKQKAQTQWTTKQDFNENTNVSIKPMLATDYDICVKVKDKNGTIAKQYFTVTVTK